ncbi:MAG: aminotransferase class I/II-fold pyridoxal phosphate-dependent enzyme, partial [Verrucomicrobia bacterium]|nr:aminotransferase class I/II-fold pyridoxal phosphate-dependent enzyme [Verrucomicrobiota bacterium]
MKKSAANSALSALGRRIAAPPISWLMQAALSRPRLISLAAGFTNNPSLPCAVSRRLLDEILKSEAGPPALQYGITAGETNLRRLTAAHVQALDATAGGEAHCLERLIISGGSQQLIYMTIEALCDEDDIVLVEDPTYFVFLAVLQSRAIRPRGVRIEQDGIVPASLEQVLAALKKSGAIRRVKALYLVSY